MATYPATTIANEFLLAAEVAYDPLTHMKVQKLVYLAHGWHLAFSESQPLVREDILAWRYGPVIQELYDELAHYGSGTINRHLFAETLTDPTIPQRDHLAHHVVRAIWDGYGHHTAYQLSTLTHQDGTPWDWAIKNHEGTIPNEVIREHFAQLAPN